MAGIGWLVKPIARTDITKVYEEMTDSTWDAFVCAQTNAHYAQSSGWAKIKKTIGWEQKRIVLKEQEQILAGVQLLFHTTPFLGNMMYSIKGPIIASADQKYDEEILKLIFKEARQKGCRVMVVQPPDQASHLLTLLHYHGFRTSQLIPEHSATLTLKLEKSLDQILAGMKRQTRQNVHRGEREGMQTRVGDQEDLKVFYQLHQETSRRQGFVPYPWEYIDTMWQVFRPQDHIMVLLAQYKETIVSTLLLICFGNTVFAYLLGWSGLYKEFRPNDALFWGAIQWAKEHKYQYFDFGGINPEGAKAVLSGQELSEAIRNSPDFLKYGFGGEIVLSPPAYDYLPNPVFNLVYRQLMGKIGGYNPKSKLFHELRKVLIR